MPTFTSLLDPTDPRTPEPREPGRRHPITTSGFIALCLAGGLCAAPLALAAPPAIPISDSLVANADQLNVKMGSQWFGQIAKWRIGPYAVVSSKLEATRIRTNTNLLKTKSDSTLTTHFSFVMSDDASHSATVTATRAFINRSEHEFKLNKTVGLGSEGLILESDSLGALITVHADTTENWTLLKNSMIDANERGTVEAHLLNGERKIVITPVFADRRGDKSQRPSFFSRLAANAIPPAMGYEFVEEGRSLCAIQTFGGSLRGNARMVWMHKSLDAGTKVALAAAITAMLQMESSDDAQPARE